MNLRVPEDVSLWLVRHGSTAWSETGRLCGWSDVSLSARGRAEARSLRDRVAGLGAAVGVWSSDLRRARQTAKLAGLEAVPDRRLRELDFGALEGMRWDDLDEEDRESLLLFDGFRAEGGESVEELTARVAGFLASLVPGLHVVVTHGGVIRLLLRAHGIDVDVPPGEAILLGGQPRAAWYAPSTTPHPSS